MKALPILSTQAGRTSARLVKCGGCTACCERGGPVYVREEEVEGLRELGVPIVTTGGVAYIRRLADGSCPMLDRVGKRCRIYEKRPQCCRLFPLDVLVIDGRLQWAISDLCPESRVK